LNAVEIEEAISLLADQKFDPAEFPYAFLEAFGNKAATIKRLRSGNSNKSDIDGVLQTNNIHILVCGEGEVTTSLDALRGSPATAKAKAKFILATDGVEFEAENTASGETIACDYSKFPDHFGFFLALAGISTVKEIRNSAIDIKATGRLNRLYIELLQNNPDWATADRRHDMNHFMARLIFCFFAEDTNIFYGDDLFTSTIEQMSDSKSTNTHEVISETFRAMDVKIADRANADLPRWANGFPYVNGGLFTDNVDVPKFSRIARKYLLHAGRLDWQQINPDIFGSMIQAVADDEERGSLGMHYTSVENILKLLNPLFLDDLREQLAEAGGNRIKLLNLRKRMAKIRVFDPACGSGNFLVIAYKQMREIEFEINKRRDDTDQRSEIPLTNFRGIELRDFPAEIARLALIIAEFQCDVVYRGQQDALAEFLPLNAMNWITQGNSLLVNWLTVCPPTGKAVKLAAEDLFHAPLDQAEIDFENEGGETFICGNPPFAGQKKKTKGQRDDMAQVMPAFVSKYGELDYVTAFYLKAAEYCKITCASAALVSTNSIVQGRHIPLLWPAIFKQKCKIIFGHRSFLWRNNAKNNASVFCVIVGISANWTKKLYIYEEGTRKEVNNISAYLTEGSTTVVTKAKKPLSSDLQLMRSGNMPLDNGHLILEPDDASELLQNNPETSKFVHKLVGAREINQGLQRFCLWIEDCDLEEARKFPIIDCRIEQCREFRKTSSAPKLADTPWAFRDRHRERNTAIILPNLSSEKRDYRVPIYIKNKATVASNLALAIYDGDFFQLSILASRVHHLWVEAICGKLKQDFRYSNDLGWHTFPLPKLTEKQKEDLTVSAQSLLIAQEEHFPSCLNELYNDSNGENPMPDNLRHAHERNDEVLERIYIGRRFKNDTERLEKLFDLYTKMTTGKAS
jgi:MmeI, DNA-methyltransferase domain/MmeI, target recognition domain/MmeI, N-terminal domain/MmeI, helicase spacer domain/MmeI, C-terminal domain